jgi:hypothetical protein
VTSIERRRELERVRYHADPEKTKARVKAKYFQNAEKIKAKRRAIYAANRDKEKAVAKIRSAEWRVNNPNHESVKEAKKKWKQENLGKVNADTAKRRNAKMQRTPAWLTQDDYWMIEQAYELSALRTKMFGFTWHVDHVLPLQGKYVSGLHVPTNLQVIPWRDNVSKGNKHLPA